MRTRRLLLFAILAVAGSVVPAASGKGPQLPGAGYGWAQPGCAPAQVCCAQPSFRAGIFGTSAISNLAAAASYAWVQPGTAPVTTPFSQR